MDDRFNRFWRGIPAGKNQNALFDEHLDKIVLTYQKRESVEKYAYLAGKKRIFTNMCRSTNIEESPGAEGAESTYRIRVEA